MDSEILSESTDSNELADAAGRLAASTSADDIAMLASFLGQADFLGRLDDDDDYFGIAEDLRLAGVFETLLDNAQPARDQLLLQLTTSTVFLAEEARTELLISGLRVVRPAPEPAIRFWDRHCQPGDGYCARTVESALANGSIPALQLVAAKLRERGFEVADRSDWLHNSVVPRRDQLAVLQMGASVLFDGDEQALKLAVVDSLFDYRKEEWYSMHTKIVPPQLDEMSAESAVYLSELAQRLLSSSGLPEQQRSAVEATLAQLQMLDSER